MIRVLIAEDSVTVRELLQAVLSADPEIVIAGTAKNGLEAAEMTKRLQPDVVTMDINMPRSEEHTSELQSLMRISYAVFCLKKKKKTQNKINTRTGNQQKRTDHKTPR